MTQGWAKAQTKDWLMSSYLCLVPVWHLTPTTTQTKSVSVEMVVASSPACTDIFSCGDWDIFAEAWRQRDRTKKNPELSYLSKPEWNLSSVTFKPHLRFTYSCLARVLGRGPVGVFSQLLRLTSFFFLRISIFHFRWSPCNGNEKYKILYTLACQMIWRSWMKHYIFAVFILWWMFAEAVMSSPFLTINMFQFGACIYLSKREALAQFLCFTMTST